MADFALMLLYPLVPQSLRLDTLYTTWIMSPYPTGESREVRALPLLVDAFVQVVESCDLSSDQAKLHFTSLPVFANMTVVWVSKPLSRWDDFNRQLTPFSLLSPQPTDGLKAENIL
ncbi:hypothetical protein BYT27DRAFT_7262864 [Phlegmacium glaucopus]|nr:hypothetical protein BYT27DRAFT_7262864 [Phlegmacium glaucopus]